MRLRSQYQSRVLFPETMFSVQEFLLTGEFKVHINLSHLRSLCKMFIEKKNYDDDDDDNYPQYRFQKFK